MQRETLADMVAFLAVAEARSFTRAAATLGVSQSALSQIVRRLETRLAMRLLTRTTRSVALTAAGEQIVATLAPALQDLDASIAAIGEAQRKPSGLIRITTVEHAANTILFPALRHLKQAYPAVTFEIAVGYDLIDIVAEKFDAGVRLGEHVAQNMISVRISQEIPMVLVAAPEYFRDQSEPHEPRQLLSHRCITLRLAKAGLFQNWRFQRQGDPITVRVQPHLILNSIDLMRKSALAGLGIAYLPRDQVQADLDTGLLVTLLDDWLLPLPPYHLYYPDRRFKSSAFSLLLETLRRPNT